MAVVLSPSPISPGKYDQLGYCVLCVRRNEIHWHSSSHWAQCEALFCNFQKPKVQYRCTTVISILYEAYTLHTMVDDDDDDDGDGRWCTNRFQCQCGTRFSNSNDIENLPFPHIHTHAHAHAYSTKEILPTHTTLFRIYFCRFYGHNDIMTYEFRLSSILHSVRRRVFTSLTTSASSSVIVVVIRINFSLYVTTFDNNVVPRRRCCHWRWRQRLFLILFPRYLL